MTNHKLRPAGSLRLTHAYADIFLMHRVIDLQILFHQVRVIRAIPYNGFNVSIMHLISEIESVAVLPDGVSRRVALIRAYRQYNCLRKIVNDLEEPSAAKAPLRYCSTYGWTNSARVSSGAADEI